MPKHCSVPNCKNDSGSSNERKSFYKFPLQDQDRLQQWLKNMGQENWTPSRHQYICNEHFEPSCFKVRWGIRYLETDAVPTIFHEKRKAMDEPEKEAKRLRTASDCKQSQTVSDDGMTVVDAVQAENTLHTVNLYEITADSSQRSETSLPELSVDGYSVMFASAHGFEIGGKLPAKFFQRENNVKSCGETTEVVLVAECPVMDRQEELLNVNTVAILTPRHEGFTNNSTLRDETVVHLEAEGLTPSSEEFLDLQQAYTTQVIAYFETIPNVFPSETSTWFAFPPDTVLSSALSPKPIPSTVPIVSKHTPSSQTSVVVKGEGLESNGGNGDDGESDEDSMESEDHQLEEHSYHKNSLNKQQLETVVVELQKKVKVLQQRHRQHVEKLMGLENTVSQLRQNNLLNEERLQLLEMAYVQTSTALTDAGETVAIIYDEDAAAYLTALH